MVVYIDGFKRLLDFLGGYVAKHFDRIEFVVDEDGVIVKYVEYYGWTYNHGGSNIEYEGVSYYEIIEVNREVLNTGAVTSAGRASITVEYCK